MGALHLDETRQRATRARWLATLAKIPQGLRRAVESALLVAGARDLLAR